MVVIRSSLPMRRAELSEDGNTTSEYAVGPTDSERIVAYSSITGADDHSWISEGASGFGIVARAASPVTCQCSDRPEQRNQKKQLAPRDT
jgi:hypothetical protein